MGDLPRECVKGIAEDMKLAIKAIVTVTKKNPTKKAKPALNQDDDDEYL